MLSHPPPTLGDRDDQRAGIRQIVGRARSLASSCDWLISDLWILEPITWRATEGFDFWVEISTGEAVLVSFGLAPLVIAIPKSTYANTELPRLQPTTRRLLPEPRIDGGASEVQRVSEVVQTRSNCGRSSEELLREALTGTQAQARPQA